MEIQEVIKLIERQICFDAQADDDGRCSHHGGKCYELGLLVKQLKPKTNSELKCPECDEVVEELVDRGEDHDPKCEGCLDWEQTRRDQEWDYRNA
jgi:hypothetical protein